KNSFLLDKIGEKVGSDKFTLLDEPHLIGASGARYFDSEGVATERRTVFDKELLKTYYSATYNAKKMGVGPTVANPSIRGLRTVGKGMDGVVAGVARGIFVTPFDGANSDRSTGDFSYGMAGLLTEKGNLTQPLPAMNVTGNMIT